MVKNNITYIYSEPVLSSLEKNDIISSINSSNLAYCGDPSDLTEVLCWETKRKIDLDSKTLYHPYNLLNAKEKQLNQNKHYFTFWSNSSCKTYGYFYDIKAAKTAINKIPNTLLRNNTFKNFQYNISGESIKDYEKILQENRGNLCNNESVSVWALYPNNTIERFYMPTKKKCLGPNNTDVPILSNIVTKISSENDKDYLDLGEVYEYPRDKLDIIEDATPLSLYELLWYDNYKEEIQKKMASATRSQSPATELMVL